MVDQGVRGQIAYLEQATPRPALGLQGHRAIGDARQLARRSRAQREAGDRLRADERQSPWARTFWLLLRLLLPPLLVIDALAWICRLRQRPRRTIDCTRHDPIDRAGRVRSAALKDRELACRDHLRQRVLKLSLAAMCIIPLAGYLAYAFIHGADARVPGVRGGTMQVMTWVWVYVTATAMLATFEIAKRIGGWRRTRFAKEIH